MKSSTTNALFIVAFIALSMNVFSQADQFSVKFGGFVKTDAFYDTRQMLSLREGHVSTWPAPVKNDFNGEDLNEGGNFNMLSIQSRVFTKVEGPGVFGGKTSGYMEAEFLGSTEGTVNSLRLRHAFVDLDFDNLQIRAGQFWHPLFSTDNYPDVISFNTGIPFIPFNRAPQIKLTGKFGGFKPFLAFMSQRDFASDGPNGVSPIYLRNSGIPEIAAGFAYSDPTLSYGLAISTKSILPNASLTIGGSPFKNDDQLRTISASANLKIKMDKFQIKLMGNYGQNNSDFLMLGGYGVKSQDNAAHTIEYTPISSASGWLELMYKDAWEYGAVFGLAQNLGASDNLLDFDANSTDPNHPIVSYAYGRGLDIDKVMKVYPRIAYNFNKTKLGFEVEYSQAYYGDKISTTSSKKVENAKAVSNIRFLLAFYVFF